MVHGIDKHLVVGLVCITFIVCKQNMKNMTHKQNIIVGIVFRTLKKYNIRIIQISQNKKHVQNTTKTMMFLQLIS